MKYPAYKYSYYSQNGFYAGRPILTSRIPETFSDEAYAHTMQYDETIRSHLDKSNKITDYYGSRYSEYFPIDIDLAKDLPRAKELTALFLETINQKYDVDLRCLRIYFSGSKGFHVFIPSILFDVSPHTTLEKKYRILAKQLFSDHPIMEAGAIDFSIYCRNRFFRVSNSLHPKSDLYKIPLTWEELRSLSVEDIQTLARSPRKIEEEIPLSEVEPNPKLTRIYQTCLNCPTTHIENDPTQLLKVGVQEGNRGDQAFKIARNLRDADISPDEMNVVLRDWNKLNNPPIEQAGWPKSLIKATINYRPGSRNSEGSKKLKNVLRNHPIFRTNILSEVERLCAIALLTLVNDSTKEWCGTTIHPGEVICSHKQLGLSANISSVNSEATARRTLKKLINQKLLVKVEQLEGNRGILYRLVGDFEDLFTGGQNHPAETPSQITPLNSVARLTPTNHSDTLQNEITPSNPWLKSSTKNLLPFAPFKKLSMVR